MRHILSILVLISVILASCGQSATPESADFAKIDERGWSYGDSVKFHFPADSTDSGNSRLGLAVRHGSAYKYANLWLEVTVEDGNARRIDTVNVKLSDKFGRRLGRGNGVSFIKVDTLPFVYPSADSIDVYVRHIMRVDTIYDIEQIGIIEIK